MLNFFEIATLEMWPDYMFQAIDTVATDHVPRLNNRPVMSLVFVSFIFITSFFVMNLFISVIVDKFNHEIQKRQGALNFTDHQKEWVKIQRLMVTYQPKVIPIEPSNRVRLFFFRLVQHKAFEWFILAAIFVNTAMLSADHYGKPEWLEKTLNYANYSFVLIFTLEAVFKIGAFGLKYYWWVSWNKFDFVILLFSLLSLNETLFETLNINVTVFRIIKVTRLLKMLKTSKGLRSLLKTLYMSLPNIIATAALLSLLLFTFAVAGMSLFDEVPYGDFINEDVNFDSFYSAFMTLTRSATGESWNGIMHECFESTGIVAVFFWVVFQMVTFFVFMNIFIAVIYDSFISIQDEKGEDVSEQITRKDLKNFQNTWAYFNPQGDAYMRTLRLPDFIRELPPPLGYKGILVDQLRVHSLISSLNIKDHEGRVYYPQVMWAIFHSVFGINDPKVSKCQQIRDILKVLQIRFKDLPKKLTLEALCGLKYDIDEITAMKCIYGSIIIHRLKEIKQRRLEKAKRVNGRRQSKLAKLNLSSLPSSDQSSNEEGEAEMSEDEMDSHLD